MWKCSQAQVLADAYSQYDVYAASGTHVLSKTLGKIFACVWNDKIIIN